MSRNSIIKLPRLYTDQDLSAGHEILLSKGQMHYLKNVLRKGRGDAVRVFNGRDGEWTATLEKSGKKEALLRTDTKLRSQKKTHNRISLIFAPLKKTSLDFLVEKAVELNVTEFYPVLTKRTEVRKINMGRLQTRIIESAEQCERLDIPALHNLVPLEEILEGWGGGKILAAIERSGALPLSKFKPAGECAFLIGPEGGFTEQENEQLGGQTNIQPVSLGENILRAETAALFCLSFAAIAVSQKPDL